MRINLAGQLEFAIGYRHRQRAALGAAQQHLGAVLQSDVAVVGGQVNGAARRRQRVLAELHGATGDIDQGTIGEFEVALQGVEAYGSGRKRQHAGLANAVRVHGEPGAQGIHSLGLFGLGPFEVDGITGRIDGGIRAPPPADTGRRHREVGANVEGAFLVPRQSGGSFETDVAESAQAVPTLTQGQIIRADPQHTGTIATETGRGAGIVVEPDAASREASGLVVIGESQQAGRVQFQLLGFQTRPTVQTDIAAAIQYQGVGLERVELPLGQNQTTGAVVHLSETDAFRPQRHRGALGQQAAG